MQPGAVGLPLPVGKIEVFSLRFWVDPAQRVPPTYYGHLSRTAWVSPY